MAFNRENLFKMAGPSNGYTGKFQLWGYKTADVVGDVDAAGYFSDAADLVKIGDVILRITVTNLGVSTEAFSTGGFHVVSASSLAAGVGTVDVNNVLALTTVDSD